MPSDEDIINKLKLSEIPPNGFYISDFITEEEEKSIIANIYASPKPKWTQLSNRRLQNWGGVPHSKGMIAEAIPAWLNTYLEKIHNLSVMNGNKLNHVLVNEYLPGQGIMPHLDGDLFYPTITTISVGSHIVLKFLEPVTDGDRKTLEHRFSLLLEPRSLLVLQDKLFERYLHCIEELKEDTINSTLANFKMCSGKYSEGGVLNRDTRISLTIRHVPKTTSFKLNIGNK